MKESLKKSTKLSLDDEILSKKTLKDSIQENEAKNLSQNTKQKQQLNCTSSNSNEASNTNNINSSRATNENKATITTNINSNTNINTINITRNQTYNHKTYTNQINGALSLKNNDVNLRIKQYTPKKDSPVKPTSEPIIKTILPLNTSILGTNNSNKNSVNTSKNFDSNNNINTKNSINKKKSTNHNLRSTYYQSPKISSQSNIHSPQRTSINKQTSPSINICLNKTNSSSDKKDEKMTKTEVLQKLNIESMKYLPSTNDTSTQNKKR